MKKNMKKIIILAILLFFIIVAPTDFVSGSEDAWKGLNNSAKKGYGDEITKNADIPAKIGTLVGSLLAFVGIIFFLLMIYGGLLWMTARGNDQKVQKAKELIESAIVGLIIVLAAYAITAYIGGALTGPVTP